MQQAAQETILEAATWSILNKNRQIYPAAVAAPPFTAQHGAEVPRALVPGSLRKDMSKIHDKIISQHTSLSEFVAEPSVAGKARFILYLFCFVFADLFAFS